MPGNVAQKPADQSSQLIEIVGPGHINVVDGFYFSALLQGRNTEHHDRNLLVASSGCAYSLSDGEYLRRIKPQAEKNQVGRVEPGLPDRFLFTSGCCHLIAAEAKKPLYPVTRLVDIFNDQDD